MLILHSPLFDLAETKELKVLVDLAMISAAGQGDMEEKMVDVFHSAVLGYAPLIYDLKPDSTFEEFLANCKNVWRSLESNPRLPENLVCYAY